jgi:predicted dehydrogenase
MAARMPAFWENRPDGHRPGAPHLCMSDLAIPDFRPLPRKASGRPLTVALVGAGGFGATHLRVIEKMEKEGLAALRGVVDPNLGPLSQSAARLAARGVPWFGSWEEMAQKIPPCDCVVLSVPIPLHFEYAAKAYETGAYVYLEKPPVPQLAQLEELIALEGTVRRIQVGFTFPYSSTMRTLEERLAEGSLGEILSYRLAACWPRNDAYYARTFWAGKLQVEHRAVYDGPATNALAHRLHDLFGIETLVTGTLAAPARLVAELYRARPLESYDVCCARGEFPSGASFSLCLSHAVARRTELVLKLVGTKGNATIQGSDLILEPDQGPAEFLSAKDEALVLAYRDFFQTAREGGRPKVGLLETWPYVAATNAMFQSSGGIHSIAPEHYRRIPTDGGLYAVNGLEELSGASFREGKTFSELGAPWGVPGKNVTLPVCLPAPIPSAARRQAADQTGPAFEPDFAL